MSDFNPKEDKIAVVIKDFTLKRKGEGLFNRYSEPYILSMAIDQSGAKAPTINFNVLPFPKVRKGDTISFDGQGHLIYGPQNPGEFLAYSITFMESDQDVRDAAGVIEGIVKSEAVKVGAKALLVANPTYATAVEVIGKLSDLVISAMKKNKDDELFRRSGTLLRDVTPAYDILRTYTSENDFIKTNVAIIPLKTSNNLGASGKKIELE